MKNLLLAVITILTICFIFPSSSEASSFRTVQQVNGSSVIVKQQPTANSASLETLVRGDFVTVMSTNDGWSYIEVNMKKGYVPTSFLKNPHSSIKIASSKGGLVVKSSPTINTMTKAVLQHQMIVEDFGSVGNGWSFVQYGNITGYVKSAFIGQAKTATKYANGHLDVRNIASPSGEIHSVIPNNTKVQVHSIIAGWAYVTVGNTRGYVVNRFLANYAQSQQAATIQFYEGLVPKGLNNKVEYEYYYGSNVDFSYAYYFNTEYSGSASTNAFSLTLNGGPQMPTSDRYSETRTGFTYEGFATWDDIPVKIDYPAKKGNMKSYTANGKQVTSKVLGVKENFSFGHSTAPMKNVVVIEVVSGQDKGMFIFEVNKGLVATMLTIQSRNYVAAATILD